MKDKKDLKIFKDYKSKLDKFNNNIRDLETYVNMLQAGDGNPYWNGSNAYKYIKSLATQIEKNKVLLENLEKCYKNVNW